MLYPFHLTETINNSSKFIHIILFLFFFSSFLFFSSLLAFCFVYLNPLSSFKHKTNKLKKKSWVLIHGINVAQSTVSIPLASPHGK